MATIERQTTLEVEIKQLKRKVRRMEADKIRRDQMLADLESALDKFKVLAHNAGDGIWVTIDGKIVFSNPIVQTILDRSEAELQYLPISELVHPEDAEILESQLSPSTNGDQRAAPSVSVRFLDRKGSVRWVNIRCVQTIWDSQPACLGFLSDAPRDKREKNAIREREQFYSALIGNSQDGVAIIQKDRVVYANQRLADMVGYSVAETIGEPLWRFVHPDALDTVKDRYNRRMAGDARHDLYEAAILTRDNRRLEVEISTQVIHFHRKAAEFVYIRDISKRKADELARKQREDELSALVQNLADFILVIDADASIKYESPSVSRILGYPPGYLIGKSGLKLIHPEDVEHVSQDLLEVIAGQGTLEPTEFRLKNSEDEWLTFEAVAENLLDHPVLQGIVITGREITMRKRAEEEIRSLRDFNERIVHSMLEGILVQDQDGYYSFANPAAAEILGYTPEDLIGTHWREIILEEDYPVVAATLERRQQGISDSYQVRMRRKDGSTVICWESGNPLFDQGAYVGAVGVYSDITELRETEQRNRRLFEQQIYVNRLALALGNLTELDDIYESTFQMVKLLVPVDVFLVNSFNPEEKSMSSGFIRAYGGKFDSHAFPKIPYGDDQHKLMRSAVETGQPAYYADFSLPEATQKRIEELAPTIGVEHQRLLKLVMLKSHSMLAIPMKVSGRTTGVLILQSQETDAYSQEDIDLLTALANMAAIAVQNARLLEQARQQSEEIQQIINTVPDGVLLLDASNITLQANRAAQVYLQTLTTERVGERLTHLGERSLEELLEQTENGIWHEISTGKQTFQMVGHPIERGPVHGGCVVVIRDVTQEREVEDRVQLQDRLATVGQLAAGIAHDFNNIMSTIVLYAQMTAQSELVSGRDRERVATIYQQAMHATDLIRQILDFSRKAILERQPVPLRPLLKEQAHLFERTLGEDIHIKLVGMRTRGFVFADPTRIQQVMLNLAINARDAMPNGGTLQIGLDEVTLKRGSRKPIPGMPPGKWVRLTVADDGTGIAPKDLPHIFEPFYTTKAAGEGTGLGLAQVYGIISQHDGFIDVSSEPDSGTRFTIYLPALDEKVVVSPDIDSGVLSPGRMQTVLLVEDNEFVRQALIDSLELLNYQVVSTSNGREALEMLLQQNEAIELVISDAIMPEMSGLSLIHEMGENGIDLPVVLLSGYATGKDLPPEQELGRVEILPKPPQLEQLAEVISRMVGNEKR